MSDAEEVFNASEIFDAALEERFAADERVVQHLKTMPDEVKCACAPHKYLREMLAAARLEQAETVKQMYDDGLTSNLVYEYLIKRIAALSLAGTREAQGQPKGGE